MDYFSESGKPMGFNTAIISEIGKQLGINIEFISVDSGARAVALASGAADIVFWSENSPMLCWLRCSWRNSFINKQ